MLIFHWSFLEASRTLINHWSFEDAPLTLQPPQLFSFESPTANCTFHGLLYRPPDFDESKKYPVILYVYGGPHIQLVNNSFKGVRYDFIPKQFTVKEPLIPM